MSKFVRHPDADALRRHGSHLLYDGESCHVTVSRIETGASGHALHVHKVDQLYYVLEGDVQVQLGDTQHSAGADTAMFVPAETPHRIWNTGMTDALLFEVMAPAPNPAEPIDWTIAEPSDSQYAKRLDWELDPLANARAYVRRLADVEPWQPVIPNFGQRMLHSPVDCTRLPDGTGHMLLYVCDLPQGGKRERHIHSISDQFYYVLSGELSVEVALDSVVVGPHSLVVLPAGVPHTLWNAGPDDEQHLSFVAPLPPLNEPTDHFVEFTYSGRSEI